jgi:anti-anti-sigma factor
MIIQRQDPTTFQVTGLQELAAINAAQVRDEIRAALPPTCTRLDLDLSGVTSLDSSGLGALVALHKTLRSQQGTLRLCQPQPVVRQLLQLLCLDEIFEVKP